jgi:hypothetical protein
MQSYLVSSHFHVLFLSRGSPIGGVSLLSYKGGQYSFKGGNTILRGIIFLDGKSFNSFLYDFNVFFGV